jgi:hypothetical protein
MPDIEPATPLRLTNASQSAAAASLAGGMIAASGRAYTLEEAISVYYDVHHAMFPAPGHGRYDMWKSKHDPKKAIRVAACRV